MGSEDASTWISGAVRDGALVEASQRVVNGVVTTTSLYPFMASLIVSSANKTVTCSGTYVGTYDSAAWVLTAGHCLVDEPTSIQAYFLREVFLQASDDEIELEASKFFIHSGFKDETGDNGSIYNDLGIIRFPLSSNTTLPFDPVALATEGSEVDHGADLSIVGWGVLTEDQSASTQRALHNATLDAICTKQCQHSFFSTNVDIITEEHICAGSTGSSICYGDSGGPLLYKTPTGTFVQVGVASFSATCDSSKPNVFTRMSTYTDLIKTSVPTINSTDVDAAGSGVCDLKFRLGLSFAIIGFVLLTTLLSIWAWRCDRAKQRASLREMNTTDNQLAAYNESLAGSKQTRRELGTGCSNKSGSSSSSGEIYGAGSTIGHHNRTGSDVDDDDDSTDVDDDHPYRSRSHGSSSSAGTSSSNHSPSDLRHTETFARPERPPKEGRIHALSASMAGFWHSKFKRSDKEGSSDDHAVV